MALPSINLSCQEVSIQNKLKLKLSMAQKTLLGYGWKGKELLHFIIVPPPHAQVPNVFPKIHEIGLPTNRAMAI
jgi:hypothetical protein